MFHAPSTRWTLIKNLQSGIDSSSALENLCSIYWRPILGYFAQGGSMEDAEDLTQTFFSTVVMDGIFEKADRSQGRLRTLLLHALNLFQANASRAKGRQKRGGRFSFVPLPEEDGSQDVLAMISPARNPAEAFDLGWLQTLVAQVLHKLRESYVLTRSAEVFDELQWAVADLTDRSTEYNRLAEKWKIAPNSVRVKAHRLRQRFKAMLLEEISQTIADESQLREEVAHLIQISSFSA
jgi:hypothetical protein